MCVILGKLFDLLVPQFPCKTGYGSVVIITLSQIGLSRKLTLESSTHDVYWGLNLEYLWKVRMEEDGVKGEVIS